LICLKHLYPGHGLVDESDTGCWANVEVFDIAQTPKNPREGYDSEVKGIGSDMKGVLALVET
jgi:hypothetical protein